MTFALILHSGRGRRDWLRLRALRRDPDAEMRALALFGEVFASRDAAERGPYIGELSAMLRGGELRFDVLSDHPSFLMQECRSWN